VQVPLYMPYPMHGRKQTCVTQPDEHAGLVSHINTNRPLALLNAIMVWRRSNGRL